MTTDVPITAYVVGSTFIDALAAGFVLLGRRRGKSDGANVGLARLAFAAALTAAAFLVKVPVLWVLGVHMFGLIHLVYVDLVVLVPLLGAALWLASRPVAGRRPRLRLTSTARLVATAALGLAAVGIYATCIEPFRLRFESAHLDVSDRRAGRSSLRVGVISDIQTVRVTAYERRAVDALMAQMPDVILIPGDVFQGTAAQFQATRPALRDLLGRLSAPAGVFLVLGDVDGAGDHLREIIRDTNIRLLVDEAATVSFGDRRVTVGGVSLDFRSPASRGLVHRLETSAGEDDIRILLAHRPDVSLDLGPGSRLDLVVAGHTHGGQIVIPGFGPPMTLSRVPRTVAAGGLHRLDGNAVYVSRGVGCERGQAPRIRFFCPPEVAIIQIGGSPSVLPDGAVENAERARDSRPRGSGLRAPRRNDPGPAPEPLRTEK